MRRALLEELPALTKFFGLKPWDIDRLTARELHQYRTWQQEYIAEMERG